MTKKKIFISLGVIAVIFILLAVFGRKDKKGIMVAAEKAATRNIVEEVTASGTIYPESEVKISPDVSGEIIDLYVQEGDTVKKGQLLVRINPDIYQTQLEQAKAGLNNAKASSANIQAQLLRTRANVELQRKNFEMQEKLYKEKVISQQEYNTAEAQYEMSRAELKAAEKQALASEYNTQSVEASVNQAGKTYNRTSVVAPTDGVITGLVSKRGERVVGTAQMAGTEMMRIANLNDMEVSVDLNENDIVKVALGDTALVEVDSYGTRKFKGVVTEIANSATTTTATTSDQVTNFVVKIRILRSSYADLSAQYGSKRSVFRPGMSASVDIQTQSVNDVVAIPIESVTMRDKSELDSAKTETIKVKRKSVDGSTNKKTSDEQEMVFVFNDGKVILRAVKTGIQNDKLIEIKEGLQVGDEVVSAPFSAITRTLKNNTAVKKVAKDELFETKPE